ncbi:hypothetical protein GKO32_24825 [Amycolatopsis sp. RM579]|uniref:Uncharacterized protein n=1 Tax=Amycolatopsis pithecellobii TaxID=664692 RepID=A0A6N7YZ42_9PSEU|nr:hypothetical protein [Amycolatopsis pithecellobii]
MTWQPTSDWQRIGYQALAQLWLPLGLIAVVMFTYKRFLHRRLTTELAKLTGPTIVGSMPPQQVIESFLSSVYGRNDANRDVVAGILGGDLTTISTRTDVHLRLSAVSHDVYRLRNTITYRFRKNVTASHFIVFATSDARLRDAISYACEFPLFELWFIPDDSLFQHGVDSMLGKVEIGVDYRDYDNQVHSLGFRELSLKEVKFREWSRYLPLFSEPVGSFPRQHAHDYLGSLRIFDCDLDTMIDDGPPIESVERLSVRQAALERIDEGACYWLAPYPCYVDHISIDVRELDFEGSGAWEFLVMPFCFRASNVASSWLPAEEMTSVELRSWLLPGHGVALLWRAAKMDRVVGSGP